MSVEYARECHLHDSRIHGTSELIRCRRARDEVGFSIDGAYPKIR